MANKVYVSKTSLTGGGAGALDSLSGTALVTSDLAQVYSTDAIIYHYKFSSAATAAESSPSIIAPDAGPGRWTLQHPYSEKIIQVVNTSSGAVATGSTQIPYDDTKPQNSEGDEFLTQAITPLSATNILIILVSINIANSAGGGLTVALFQDSTADSLCCSQTPQVNINYNQNMVLVHKMVSGTTSSTTFKVRAGSAEVGTTTLNGLGGGRKGGGILNSSITIIEVVP